MGAFCLGAFAPFASSAQNEPAEYAITEWVPGAGLPDEASNIYAITQDAEGYLWVGTTGGLFRFDGFQFQRWGARGERKLPGNSIRALAAAPDGSVWIGYADVPGVSRIRHSDVTSYSDQEGLRGSIVHALVVDRDGTIWAGGGEGLLTFKDGKWELVAARQGLPIGQVFGVYEDSGGRIWVGTPKGVLAREPEARTFHMVAADATFVQGIVQDSEGAIWATDSRTLIRSLRGGRRLAYSVGMRLPLEARNLLLDSTGALWVAGLGGGLLRVPAGRSDAAVVESFTNPKVTGSVRALFRDRENNVWIGMRGGLLRLSEGVVASSPHLEGLMHEGVRGLTTSSDGSVWIGTTYAVNRFIGTQRQVFNFGQTLALHTDRSGVVWLVTPHGIYKFTAGRFVAVDVPPDLQLENITALTSDVSGALWLCDSRSSLVRWHGAELNRFASVPSVAHRPCALPYADRQGRIWVGFMMGGVAVYRNGRFDSYGRSEGLPGGNVTAILEDGGGAIWIATIEGVSRFDGGRFVTVTSANGLPGKTWSLVEDGEGFILASGTKGLVRFHPREFDRLATDPSRQIEYALFDGSDGLPLPLASQGRPSSVLSRDGSTWFASLQGVSILEPSGFHRVRGTIASRIESLLVDGRPAARSSDVPAVPYGSPVEIGYSALSLSMASKLRFRYKLDGFDSEWNHVGNERRATYTTLPPGQYVFRVSATDDGVWRETESRLAVTVLPPFYKATWFYAVSGASFVVGLWGYWRSRLRTIRSRHELVLAERARVSRDIHDTLLQSLTAVGLELEVVARVIGPTHQTGTDTVRDCQRRIAECVREARQAVWNLRSPSLERHGLAEALRELAAHSAPRTSPRINVTVSGKALPFSSQAEEELLRVAREAITNAVRHGQPQSLAVDLRYGDQSVTLRITDDGCGFAPEDVTGRRNHYGLRNMRERVTALNGQLRVRSNPTQGTIVEATIPCDAL